MKTFSPTLYNLGIWSIFWFLTWQASTNLEAPTLPPDQPGFCAQEPMNQAWLDTHPQAQADWNKWEQKYQTQIGQGAAKASYTIPVVVHIIHQNGAENIPDATVLQGMDHLNAAYANMGYYDQGTGVNTDIEFCLAKRDPEGNATTGINRVESPLTNMIMETEDLALKNLIRWEPLDYLNIWLVAEICSNSSGCGVAGYAYFPAAAGSDVDGIVMEAQWFGSSESNSVVQVHEAGHYLGLYHTFQGGCLNNDCLVNGDRVCDTPPDASTAPVICGNTVNTCSTDTDSGFATDQNDMYINYMDYGDFDCYSAFTQGQTNRMVFTLDGVRSSLQESQGCLDPCLVNTQANFTPNQTTYNVGQTAFFNNTSTNATNYEWFVDGVSVANSTNYNQVFVAEGYYVITLTATNADPNCQSVFSDTIQVVCPVNSAFTISNATPIAGETVSFNNLSQNANAFEWSINGVGQSTNPTFSTNFLTDGNYQVCLTSQNGFCADQYCQYVFVSSTPSGDCETTFAELIGFQNNNQPEGIYSTFAFAPDIIYGGGFSQDGPTLFRFDGEGNLTWARGFTEFDQNHFIRNIEKDSENNLLIWGWDQNFPNNSTWFMRYDPEADQVLWLRRFSLGDRPRLNDFIEDPNNGNFWVFGTTENFPGASEQDALLFLIDRNTGDLLDHQFYNLGTTEGWEESLLYQGHYFACGYLRNGSLEDLRPTLARFDGFGNLIWAKYYQESFATSGRSYMEALVIENDMIYSVARGTLDGTDLTNGRIHWYQTDLNGNQIATRVFQIPGGNSLVTSGLFSIPDGFLVYGTVIYNGDQDLFLAKLDKQGNGLWCKKIGKTGTDETSLYSSLMGSSLMVGGRSDAGNETSAFLLKLDDYGETIPFNCNWIEDLELEEIPNQPLFQADANLTVYTSSVPIGTEFTSSVELDFPIEPDCSETICCSQTTAYSLGTPDAHEEARCIVSHPDGSYYLGGLQGNSSLIVKMSSDHEIIWTRSFKFTNKAEWIDDLIIDSEGYLAGVGNTELIGSVRDQFIFRYDETNDQMLWGQTGIYNNNLSNQSSLTGLYESPDQSEYWVFGQIWPNSNNFGCDGGYWKIDKSNGALNFFQNYNLGSCESFIHFDVTPSGDPLVCGRFNYINGGSNKMRAAAARLAPNGDLLWNNTYLEPESGNARMYATSILNDGNTITISGHGDSDSNSGTDIELFLFETDLNGDFIWSQYYDFVTGNNERVVTMVEGPNNNFYLGGYYTNSNQNVIGFVMQVDENGVLQWAQEISNAPASAIHEIIPYNGQLLVIGEINNSASGATDVLALQMAPDGSISQTESCDLFTPLEIETLPGGNAQENAGLTPEGEVYSWQAGNIQLQTPPLNNAPFCTDACEEICDNLIDDDGDGLIDCYDDYCTCQEECEDYFYGNCTDDCLNTTLPVDISLNPLWDSEANVYNGTHALVGDLDADGIPELVAFRRYAGGYAFDGQTGAVKYAYEVPGIINGSTQGVIGNIDGDPEGEVITWFDGTIYAFEHDGTIKWQVPRPFDDFYRWPALHDLNQDGIIELIYGRYIFSTLDGLLLATLPADAGSAIDYNAKGLVVVADFLDAADCGSPICNGLEIAGGPNVYAVTLASYTTPGANSVTTVATLPGYGDGFTSFADYDRDGRLDIVVSGFQNNNSQRGIYIWNPHDEALIRPFIPISSGTNRLGRPCIANFDADEDLEMAMSIEGPGSTAYLRMYDNDVSEVWSVNTLDESGATGCSAFDFNADGQYELLSRDQQNLRILDGSTGTILASTPCTSGTVVEYPVIADINADGQTEITCNCGGNTTDVDIANLRTWSSANIPWPPSRPVWNQASYFITNVEDDLQIPIVQQNPHLVGDGLVINQFLTQYVNPLFSLPDAELTILDIACQDQAIVITAECCNVGDYRLSPSTPFTIYDNDPTTSGMAVNLGTFTPLDLPLEVGECVTISFQVPAGTAGSYSVVANDDASIPPLFDLATDFPSTNIYECDYENNIDLTAFTYLAPILDLGPDTVSCDFTVTVLDAGPGFEQYTWQDGFSEQSYTAFEPGTYYVITVDSCGGIQSDSITISLEIPSVLDLGADTTLCVGQSISFSLSGFDHYTWTPSTYLDCDTCATVTSTPDSTVTYLVQATLNELCTAYDTITILVEPAQFTTDTLSLCNGDTITIFGDPVTMTGTYQQTFTSAFGCDSTHTVTVFPLDTTILQYDTLTICQGETIAIFGQNVDQAGTYVQVDSSTSCLVIDSVSLIVFDTAATFETIIICENEMADIFGNPTNIPGTYSETFSTSEGCDSTHTIELVVLDTYLLTDLITICPGDSAFILDNYETNPGIYEASYQASNGCDSTISITLEVIPSIELDISTTPSCFGENDGSAVLNINGGLPPYSIQWSSPTGGDNLAPGTYQVTIADDFGCLLSSSFEIEQAGIEALDFAVSDISCYGYQDGSLSILIDPFGLLFSLDGINFSAQTQFDGLAAGEYSLFVQDTDGCISSFPFSIIEPFELLLDLPEQYIVDLGEEVQIEGFTNISNAASFLWNTTEGLNCVECVDPIVLALENTIYELTIVDSSGCSVTDATEIIVRFPRNIYIPNAFSPDFDGINDVFHPYTGPDVAQILTFRVFDRWGELLFEQERFQPNDPAFGWDGTFRGQQMNAGIFVYLAEVVYVNGRTEVFKGDVMLLR